MLQTNLALLEAAVFCESLVFDIFWLQENFCFPWQKLWLGASLHFTLHCIWALQPTIGLGIGLPSLLEWSLVLAALCFGLCGSCGPFDVRAFAIHSPEAFFSNHFCCVLQLLVSRIAFSHLGFFASGGSIYICLLLLYQLFRVCRQRPNSA